MAFNLTRFAIIIFHTILAHCRMNLSPVVVVVVVYGRWSRGLCTLFIALNYYLDAGVNQSMLQIKEREGEGGREVVSFTLHRLLLLLWENSHPHFCPSLVC